MTSFEPRIQVYVMCYNRTTFLADSISSILQQSYQNFDVILSDNSTDDGVFNFIQSRSEFRKLTYIRRPPGLHVLEHHNLIMAEVTAPFFMMFHDDDILEYTALEKLIDEFQDPSVVASAANGFLFYNEGGHRREFNSYLCHRVTFDRPEDLVLHHIDSGKGIVPFPVYLYRTEAAQKIVFSYKEGRHYADVSFLLKLNSLGRIVWRPEFLMTYRRHGGNGSAKIDVRATLSLCRFIRSHYQISANLLYRFKMKTLTLWILQPKQKNNASITPRSHRIIRKAALIFLVMHPHVIIHFLRKKLFLKKGL